MLCTILLSNTVLCQFLFFLTGRQGRIQQCNWPIQYKYILINKKINKVFSRTPNRFAIWQDDVVCFVPWNSWVHVPLVAMGLQTAVPQMQVLAYLTCAACCWLPCQPGFIVVVLCLQIVQQHLA